ncbi:uncharacterized protein C1orf232 homolog [Bombina bombina]|uniref:uncharacterized protein C1orf232 homolog n=1 Tax=Bombina bombina TaxID=8345 RepID=UPI00235B2AEB|nr:uncharacterized protein C1orf232 homolog [Bombina bombina]
MSQGFWRVYKAKVLQTFNTEQETEYQEESDTAEMIEPENPDVGDEGLNMSQLARKVQGSLGWRSVTSLFSKEEDQRTEERQEHEEDQPPVQLPSDTTPERTSSSALWDVFSNRWRQSAAQRTEERGVLAEPPAELNETQHHEETTFKWGFLTSKLSELRNKSD